MPIARNPRNDRRRRVLRDNAEEQSDVGSATRSKRSRSSDSGTENASARRGAGYSQDVRKACGHRLVQLIPVRRRSFLCVVVASLLVPALLLTTHYMIYVSGQWAWYGHPLAFALDAGHPRSIAAWATSQLWILCLGATILTFQLRRHKLDDYGGEYRLWFWLVLTCLLGSLEASTGISELFAMALDGWSQIHLGWSGPAVVKSTIAVLIGMLGLRLCTELKRVPSSVLLMLIGLISWAGSAALSQPELLLDISLQTRHWLRAAFWLGGLTTIWLASVCYLRSVYMEAQQRFLLRGHLAAAANNIPLRQRLRESLPSMPRLRRDRDDGSRGKSNKATPQEAAGSPRRWGIPSLGRRKEVDVAAETALANPTSKQSLTNHASGRAQASEGSSQAKRPGDDRSQTRAEDTSRVDRENAARETASTQPVRRGLGGFLKRSAADAGQKPERSAAPERESAADGQREKGRFLGWLRRPKDSGEADEFKKVRATDHDREQKAVNVARGNDAAKPDSNSAPRKSWIPKMPRVRLPRIPKPSLRGITSRIKLPKLPSFRLLPPDEAPYQTSENADRSSGTLNAVNSNRQLPGTTAHHSDSDVGEGSARPMTKAERKRLRRLQQQNRAA